MKGDLVLYDSLVWLMGSLEGLPARGPEPLGRGPALRHDRGAQRLLRPPHKPTLRLGPLAQTGSLVPHCVHAPLASPQKDLGSSQFSLTLLVDLRIPWALFLSLLQPSLQPPSPGARTTWNARSPAFPTPRASSGLPTPLPPLYTAVPMGLSSSQGWPRLCHQEPAQLFPLPCGACNSGMKPHHGQNGLTSNSHLATQLGPQASG